jgi:hypothetical protein
MSVACTHARESLLTGIFAAAASLSADAAMLVHDSMPLAFGAAKSAGGHAGFQHLANNTFIRSGPTRGDGASGHADIGAIHVQADALRQLRDRRFSKACIRAGRTDLRTIKTFLDAADQGIVGATFDVRVSADHLMNVHGDLQS